MSYEVITVLADGKEFNEWKAITVSYTMTSPITSITLETSEVIDEAWTFSPFAKWHFPPGTVLHIFANGDPFVVGIVDVYRPEGQPNRHRVTLVARSPARHGVDNSYHRRPGGGAFFNMPFCQLLETLWRGTLGGNIKTECDAKFAGEIVKYHQVRPGASPYQESMRLAPMYGMNIAALRQSGGVRFDAGTGVLYSGGYLIQGLNILSMSAELRGDSRAQVQEVIGQSPQGMASRDLELNAQVMDSHAEPGSYRLHVAQGLPSDKNLQEFAKWARRQAYLQSVKARVQVPGWRVLAPDSSDNLIPLKDFWDTRTLVYVYSQWLKIDCEMLITGVDFHQDSVAGTTTTLTLSDPRSGGAALEGGGEAWSRCNNASIWAFS